MIGDDNTNHQARLNAAKQRYRHLSLLRSNESTSNHNGHYTTIHRPLLMQSSTTQRLLPPSPLLPTNHHATPLPSLRNAAMPDRHPNTYKQESSDLLNRLHQFKRHAATFSSSPSFLQHDSQRSSSLSLPTTTTTLVESNVQGIREESCHGHIKKLLPDQNITTASQLCSKNQVDGWSQPHVKRLNTSNSLQLLEEEDRNKIQEHVMDIDVDIEALPTMTKDYITEAKEYKRMECYRNSNPQLKSECVLCKRSFQLKKVFFPCEHRCVCDDCFPTKVKNYSKRSFPCPLCKEDVRYVTNHDNGNEVEMYWKWINEVKPSVPPEFLNGFARDSRRKISCSLSRGIGFDDDESERDRSGSRNCILS